MLKDLRKSAKSAVMGLVLGLMVVSLVLGFGLSGWFGGGSQFAAKVGETTISAAELQREAFNQLSRFQQFQPELTADQARAAGVGRFALTALLSRAVIAEETDVLRLAVSNERLAEEIRSIEAFQNPVTGEFDRRTYQLAIARGNFDERTFENGLREDLTRAQLLDAVTGAAAPLPGLIATAGARYALQRRSVSYVTLQPSSTDVPEDFDDDVLKARIAVYPEPYEAPERRFGAAVLIDPTRFESDADIAEEDVRALFEAEIDAISESRELILLPFGPGEEAGERALAAADRLRANGDADALIRDGGFATDQVRFTAETPEDIADERAAERAFDLSPGAVEAFEGALGWFALKVLSVEAAERPDFEERRAALEAELRRAAAVERAYEIASKVDEAVAEGATIEEAAAMDGAELRALDYEADGRAPDDAPAGALAVAFAEELFQLEEADIGGLVETDEGAFFIARLDRIQPRAVRPFADVREEARTAERRERVKAALRTLAEEIRAEAAEAGLKSVADARGLELVAVPSGLARNRPEEIIGPEDATRIVALAEGGLHAAPARYGQAWFVAEAGALVETPLDGALVERFKSEQSADFVRASVDAYLSEARESVGVVVRQDTVDAALDAAF